MTSPLLQEFVPGESDSEHNSLSHWEVEAVSLQSRYDVFTGPKVQGR